MKTQEEIEQEEILSFKKLFPYSHRHRKKFTDTFTGFAGHIIQHFRAMHA